ncbi:hypothetical protein [Lysinibacillus sp. 54212]|uniref:hypothetical protein n=1 Tax=Lysinibacillus sp. 54212 TaxID=3119829 RepID=UPI002FC6AC9F
MDPISKALSDSLNTKKMSPQLKHSILNGQRKKRNYMPSFIVVSMIVISALLYLTINVKNEGVPQEASGDARFGSVDEAIVNYFNDMVILLESDDTNQFFYAGDAYLMRLALEKNSGQFYSDSSLNSQERFLISELLHYFQEALWHGDTPQQVQQVESIKELVSQAPALIAKLEPVAEIPYIKIGDEKNNGMKLLYYEWSNWLTLLFMQVLVVAAIVFLFKNKHRKIGVLFIIVFVVSTLQLFMSPNRNNIGYDEQTIIEVVGKRLDEAHVKFGEPTLEYVSTFHNTRSALISYSDGLSALAVFEYHDGQYVYSSMTWHSGNIFNEGQFVTIDDETTTVRMLGLKSEHEVASITIYENRKNKEFVNITPGKPTIVHYIVPVDVKEHSYLYLNERGEQVE